MGVFATITSDKKGTKKVALSSTHEMIRKQNDKEDIITKVREKIPIGYDKYPDVETPDVTIQRRPEPPYSKSIYDNDEDDIIFDSDLNPDEMERLNEALRKKEGKKRKYANGRKSQASLTSHTNINFSSDLNDKTNIEHKSQKEANGKINHEKLPSAPNFGSGSLTGSKYVMENASNDKIAQDTPTENDWKIAFNEIQQQTKEIEALKKMLISLVEEKSNKVNNTQKSEDGSNTAMQEFHSMEELLPSKPAQTSSKSLSDNNSDNKNSSTDLNSSQKSSTSTSPSPSPSSSTTDSSSLSSKNSTPNETDSPSTNRKRL